MKKKIYMITQGYPNKKGHDSCFIQNEIDYLIEQFEVVVLCTEYRSNSILACKADVIYLGFSLWKALPYTFFYFFSKEGRYEIRDIIEKKHRIISRLRSSLREFACSVWFEKSIRKASVIEEGCLLYSYWCNYPAIALARIKENNPNCHAVSRIHGFELYDERDRSGRQPFKWYINAWLDKIVFIGQNPMEYYLSHHPDFPTSKSMVCRLGVMPVQISKSRSLEKEMIVVSCSSVIPLKRVDLILRALAQIGTGYSIRWVHFGDGSDFNLLRSKASELLHGHKSITYDLKGFVSNEAIKYYYTKTSIGCFITTSSTEGCPVSIMEALSAGIPIIGTDVGDIPYMIKNNGFLLTQNPSVDEVRESIEQMYYFFSNRETDEQYLLMRQASRRIFDELFNAENNAKDFIKRVLIDVIEEGE